MSAFGRVGRALALHEFVERLRDRWVLLASATFALLASAVSLYGRAVEADAATLTGPSLVTLAALFVPLVALVLSHDAIVGERERNTLGLLLSLPVRRGEVVVAKFLGRGAALVAAVVLGLGTALAVSDASSAGALVALVGPTLRLGLVFVAIGLFVSSCASRQASAASIVVAAWFALVLFYEVGLLGLLVATDGAVSDRGIAALVVGNPTGLYRVEMMQRFAGGDSFGGVDLAGSLPGSTAMSALWVAWIAVPVFGSALLLQRRKVV